MLWALAFPPGWWDSRGVVDVEPVNPEVLKDETFPSWSELDRSEVQGRCEKHRGGPVAFGSGQTPKISVARRAEHSTGGQLWTLSRAEKCPFWGLMIFPKLTCKPFLPLHILLNFHFLAMTWSICDLSSSTRDQTHIPCFGSAES